MKTLKVTLLIGLLAATVGWATPIWIDTFDVTSQLFSVTPGDANPKSASDGVAAVEAIGGFRQLDALRTNGGGRIEISTGPDGFPALAVSLSSSAGTAGTLTATWDANGAGLNADLTGLHDNFFLQAVSDLGMMGTLTVYTGTDLYSSATFQIAADPSAFALPLIVLPFGSFVAGPQGGAQFNNVTKVVLQLDGTNGADAYVDFVGVGIPEPASLFLTGGALMCLGILRRRSK